MKTDKNRTFYFLETVDESGNNIIKVASDLAPIWGKTFSTVADAIKAVKRRNSKADKFRDIRNGIVAEYLNPVNTDGDSL